MITEIVLEENVRLMIVAESDQLATEIKNVSGELFAIECFSANALLDSENSKFDCVICDSKFFPTIQFHFSCPIFITAPIQAQEQWHPLLAEGADGVLFEEMTPEGIVGQLTAFLRRLQQKTILRSLPEVGLEIDIDQYQILLKGVALDLTVTEFKVLKELAQKGNQVTNRALIQKRVFGKMSHTRSLDVHVCSLRKKLQPHGLDIESVRGVGYRLAKQPNSSQQASWRTA